MHWLRVVLDEAQVAVSQGGLGNSRRERSCPSCSALAVRGGGQGVRQVVDKACANVWLPGGGLDSGAALWREQQEGMGNWCSKRGWGIAAAKVDGKLLRFGRAPVSAPWVGLWV